MTQKNAPKEHDNHPVALMLLEDFSPAYTYLIIDEKFLMVSLTYDDESLDKRFSLYTELKEGSDSNILIKNFVSHFEAVWKGEMAKPNVVITNAAQFEHVYKYQSDAAKCLMAIKTKINKFPNHNTLFQQNVLKNLQAFSEVFDEHSCVKHTSADENLVNVFINYLDLLKKDDIYHTITFCGFWNNLLSRDSLKDRFIDANESALKKQVLVERLLVIDQDLVDKKGGREDYKDNIEKIIVANIELMKREGCGSYNFKILFAARHDEYVDQGFNFALIESKQTNEKIVFQPSYKSPLEKTTDIFVNNDEKIKSVERPWKNLNRLWEDQVPSEIQKEFIKNMALDDISLATIVKKPELFK